VAGIPIDRPEVDGLLIHASMEVVSGLVDAMVDDDLVAFVIAIGDLVEEGSDEGVISFGEILGHDRLVEKVDPEDLEMTVNAFQDGRVLEGLC
jgi:hypothetical protein